MPFQNTPNGNPALISTTKFFQPQYEFSPIPPSTAAVVSEEDGEWWSSIWTGTQTVLAITLAAVSLSVTQAQSVPLQHQDDPALSATVDEYFWDNPNKPIYVPPSQIFPDGNEQTPTLFGQYDEDFWQNPVNPYAELAKYPEQASFDEQIPAGNLSATVDDYFWNDPTLPLPTYLPPWQLIVSDELIVPQPVAFQPDEDFWNNPAAPYVLPIITPVPWGFDDQTPLFHLQLDEDFWQNQVPLIAGLSIYPQPYSFDAAEVIKSTITTQFVIWIADDEG